MIKLVACDLDGTLFNNNMSVSQENIAAIKAAQKNEIEFLVTTGRAPKESKILIQEAGLKTGFINLNGALVYNQTGKLLIKHPLSRSTAKKIIELLREDGFYFEINTIDHIYTEDINQRISNVARLMVNLNPGMTFKEAVAVSAGNKSIMNMTAIDSFEELLKNENEEIMKIVAFDSRGHEAFSDTIKDLNSLGDLAVTSSGSSNIEINNIRAQKGTALLDYAKLKGIKRDEIAAIGDNLNDESMIREAGTGVAMGNAIPAIKKLAQVVTKSNNENGVAFILRKFIEEAD